MKKEKKGVRITLKAENIDERLFLEASHPGKLMALNNVEVGQELALDYKPKMVTVYKRIGEKSYEGIEEPKNKV